MYRFFILLTLLAFPLVSPAQQIIRGSIVDASNGEALPAANIQIKDTFRGTITNAEGVFELNIPEFPATLIFRYIGFETREITFEAAPQNPISVKLDPVNLELPEIVVTGDDPALDIMREVIARKAEWRSRLQSYKANAYTRQTLSSDTAIVSIMESTSEAYWDREKGPKEVILSKRQTTNMSAENNFAGASYVPNFYDDNIEIAEFEMVGPTNPKALSFYDFKLTDYKYLDDDLVFIIEVKPKRKLQPTFEGTIKVLGDEYALLEVDLKPGESMLFPPPIQKWELYYKQQFSNFGRDFWLPVDVRIEGRIQVGMPGLQFPEIRYNQLSRISDYEVNLALPDSLYRDEGIFVVDSVAVSKNEFNLGETEPVPLSIQEARAYEEIDSTDTFEKAFKPTGALSRFVDVDDDDDSNDEPEKERGPVGKFVSKVTDGFGVQPWYNRVEEARIGLTYERTLFKKLGIKGLGAYSTGLERWAYGGEVSYPFPTGKNKRVTAYGGYKTSSTQRFQSTNYVPALASLQPLLGGLDYFDYYWTTDWYGGARTRIRKLDSDIDLKFSSSLQRSLSKFTDYDLIGASTLQRANPGIDEGRMNSLTFSSNTGGDFIPFGVVGQENLEWSIQHTGSWLGSDFDFTQLRVRGDLRFETFYKRRFMPNVLDVRLEALTHLGDLPIQNFGSLDGSLSYFSPFGTFRSASNLPIQARQYAAVYWEHNFRTIPTELLGLRGLAKKGWGMVAFGNHAYTEDVSAPLIPGGLTQSGFIHEIGVGLNGIFTLFRADVTYRIDQPGFFFTITAARVF